MTSSRGSSDPGIEPESLRSPALAGRFFTTSTTWEVPLFLYFLLKCTLVRKDAKGTHILLLAQLEAWDGRKTKRRDVC